MSFELRETRESDVSTDSMHQITVTERPKEATQVVLFQSPVDVTAQAHFSRGLYVFCHIVSALLQRIGISLILIFGYFEVVRGPQPLLIFLGSFQIYLILLHYYFGLRLKSHHPAVSNRAFLFAASAMTSVCFYVGAILFAYGAVANNFGLFFTLPYALLSLVAMIPSRALDRLLFAYDFLESLQLGAIYFNLVNGCPLSWETALLFYGLVAKTLMFAVIVFWIAFVIFLFLTCMIYYRANITHVDLFILFLGMLFFNLIWHSYIFKFMFDGIKELLERGETVPGGQRLQVNKTMFLASVLTAVFSTVSIGIVVLFFLRMRQLMMYYFQKENRISQITMTSFAQDLQMRIKRMSGGYFRSVEEEAVGRDVEAPPEEDPCSVCYSKVGEVLLDPCGHSGFCVECITNCLKERRTCPICRGVIEAIYLVKFDQNGGCYKAFGRINFE